MAKPPLPSAGTILGGKYRLVRRIGDGAMGVVWEAENMTTGRRFAIKLLADADPQLALRLQREGRAAGSIDHPNVIDMIDVGTTDTGDPFLVMELLQGETLSRRIKSRRRLDPPEAARIARDVARGLAAAHDRQIIHRDLKPANVFLEEAEGGDFAVKVLDFGVSKNLGISDGLHTAVGAAIGSLAYMSPEQARAEVVLDARTDLWSLGVVLFEMLTGERPLRGGAPQLIMQLSRCDVRPAAELAPGIDPGLAAVIDRCLKRREERIGSAVELAALLEPFAQAALPMPAPAEPDLQEATTMKVSPRVLASLPQPAAGAAPAPAQAPALDTPVAFGGTVRMSPELACQIPAKPARSADEVTTLPRGQRSPLPSSPTPPSGPGGTEVIVPLPTVRPQFGSSPERPPSPAPPLPPPPAPPPPPPLEMAPPLVPPAATPPAPPPARSTVLLIALLAASGTAALAALVYLLLR